MELLNAEDVHKILHFEVTAKTGSRPAKRAKPKKRSRTQ